MLLSQFEYRFPTEDCCIDYFKDVRSKALGACPKCGHTEYYWLSGFSILFRSGKFYESFKEDAEKVSRITGITLTQKDMGTGAKIPNAVFPEPALDTYLPKLVRAGERIAICDWQELAKREQQEQQPERSSYHRR